MEMTTEIVDMLGGPNVFGRKIISESDFLAAIQQGLPYRALARIKQRLKLTDNELVHSIGIELLPINQELRLEGFEIDIYREFHEPCGPFTLDLMILNRWQSRCWPW